MFHILTENSVPNYLTKDSTVECGLKVRREAISSADYRQLVNRKALNVERACKVCLKKVGHRYNG